MKSVQSPCQAQARQVRLYTGRAPHRRRTPGTETTPPRFPSQPPGGTRGTPKTTHPGPQAQPPNAQTPAASPRLRPTKAHRKEPATQNDVRQTRARPSIRDSILLHSFQVLGKTCEPLAHPTSRHGSQQTREGGLPTVPTQPWVPALSKETGEKTDHVRQLPVCASAP